MNKTYLFALTLFASFLLISCGSDSNDIPIASKDKGPQKLSCDQVNQDLKTFDNNCGLFSVDLDDLLESELDNCLSLGNKLNSYSKKECVGTFSDPEIIVDKSVDDSSLFVINKQINRIKDEANNRIDSTDDNDKPTKDPKEDKEAKKRCKFIKSEISVEDLSGLTFSKNCTEAYYSDWSNEKIDLSLTSSYFMIEPALRYHCKTIKDGAELANNSFVKTSISIMAEHAGTMQLLISREHGRSEFDDLVKKYKHLELTFYNNTPPISGGRFLIALSQKNNRLRDYFKFSENVNYRLKTKIGNLKLGEKLTIPLLGNPNTGYHLGRSGTLGVSISTAGYCYLTDSGEDSVGSDSFIKKLFNIIKIEEL